MTAPTRLIAMMSETYRPASIAKIQDQKAKMRRSLLKARQAMPPQVWQQKCDRICTQYPDLKQWQDLTRFGVNLRFVDANTPLNDGDEVVCIPPVSGG